MLRQTFNDIFEPSYCKNEMFGIRSKYCKRQKEDGAGADKPLVVAVWKSPYATAEANAMLEKDLMAVYKKYYIRTLFENCGIFWG